MPRPTYFLPASSVVFSTLQHVLTNLLSIPKEQIQSDVDYFGVSFDAEKDSKSSALWKGVLPLLRVLRTEAKTDSHRELLGGVNFEQMSAVNEWISIAALVSVDATALKSTTGYRSQAEALFTHVEHMMEVKNIRDHFLSSPSAKAPSLADFALYAALQHHPLCKDLLPATLMWCGKVHRHPLLEPVRAAHFTAPAAAATDKAPKGNKTVYVKPNEEEILKRRQEKEKIKAEKAAKQASAGAGPSPAKAEKKETPSLCINSLLDIRVGRLQNVHNHPDADRLFVEEMHLGTETRTIVSGLVGHYTADALNGSLCLVFCNMKPKPLKGVVSHGMVLCASNASKVVLVRPPPGAQPGDRIFFGDSYKEPSKDSLPPPSNSQLTEILSSFVTDDEGVVSWKGKKAWLSQGVLAVPDMKNCKVG